MSGSVAFIIDIAGATLRNAHLRLLTLLCSLRSAAGVRSATLNRCAPPIGQTGPVALWPPQPIFPSCFLTYLRRFGLVSYTYREHKKRSAPSLNTFVKTKRGFGYTQEWTAQQLRESFPWETAPRYLLRDRDRIFGQDFVEQVKAMGIKQVLSAPRSPWQRAYVERLIGTIRRECLDHMISLQRAKPVPPPARISGILSSESHALGIGEGQSRATADPAAGVGPDRLDSGAGRAASSLRTASGVNRAILMIHLSGGVSTNRRSSAGPLPTRCKTARLRPPVKPPNPNAPNRNVRRPLNVTTEGRAA